MSAIAPARQGVVFRIPELRHYFQRVVPVDKLSRVVIVPHRNVCGIALSRYSLKCFQGNHMVVAINMSA